VGRARLSLPGTTPEEVPKEEGSLMRSSKLVRGLVLAGALAMVLLRNTTSADAACTTNTCGTIGQVLTTGSFICDYSGVTDYAASFELQNPGNGIIVELPEVWAADVTSGLDYGWITWRAVVYKVDQFGKQQVWQMSDWASPSLVDDNINYRTIWVTAMPKARFTPDTKSVYVAAVQVYWYQTGGYTTVTGEHIWTTGSNGVVIEGQRNCDFAPHV